MISKKGQAAMEFLMTYGWAILVVLAAITALAYFGVFKYDKILPEHCAITAVMGCEDYVVTPDSVILHIRHGSSDDIRIDSVTVKDCLNNMSLSVPYGQVANILLTGCTNGNVGQAFKGDIDIVYTESRSGLQHTARGTVIARIQ